MIDLLLIHLTGANIRPVNSSFGVAMSTKFSEDVIPLTDLKTNPGRVMKHVSDAHRPVLLTSRGRGVAVVQSIADYEQTEEERTFMRAVVEGLMDLESGREVSIAKARKRLGLK
jgi:prevent-host-death family protein